MKSLTKKHTTENQQCMDPFCMLPLDVIVMILLKFPAKYVARLIFVSKHWSSVICSKDFIELYISQSSPPPRLLFIYNKMQTHFLESCSQENPPSDYKRIGIPSHADNDMSWRKNVILPPVRSLICLRNGTNVRIENPSTGQLLTLPSVKTRRRRLFSFFGYDPENDVYKVLCMTEAKRKSPVVSEEHQVFTLGAKQKWRKIACKYPHLPVCDSEGICINGVVYYYGLIKNDESVICFDLKSEDFIVIKLPEDYNIPTKDLVNYNGKIALWNQFDARLDLWTVQDAKKQQWSKVSHLIPSWADLVKTAREKFHFVGTLSTGQLIFALYTYLSEFPFSYISYDLKENTAKRVVIEEMRYKFDIKFHFDYLELPIVLSM